MNRIVSLWLLSLVIVGLLASALTAQVHRSSGRIVSGGDLGFRIESTDLKGRPVGTLVIRVDNQWVEPAITSKPTPATAR